MTLTGAHIHSMTKSTQNIYKPLNFLVLVVFATHKWREASWYSSIVKLRWICSWKLSHINFTSGFRLLSFDFWLLSFDFKLQSSNYHLPASKLKGSSSDKQLISLMVIMYKQHSLHSNWLRTCPLIPNQCKKVKLSAIGWNWKWLTAPTLSSDKTKIKTL